MKFFQGSKKVGRVPEIPDSEAGSRFQMPSEEEPREGTWLQWPHNQGRSSYDRNRKRLERYEESWIQMTLALHLGERVHIIVYEETDIQIVKDKLFMRGADLSRIDFRNWPTNDVWVRDNGPVFVFRDDEQHKCEAKDDNLRSTTSKQLCVTDWAFNGWGNKVDWDLCNEIPRKVASELNLPLYSIPMVNEGGSVELDGRHDIGCTLMAKRSSILNRNRNPGWTQEDAEMYFRHYLGVTNFIWLDGKKGGSDITDDHIDGTARFANGDTIVTFKRSDFLNSKEYDILASAKNAAGEPYKIVHLPLTKKKKIKGEPGIYINYYVGNEVIILPIFDDPSDSVAHQTLQELYPNRKVVDIDFTELY